MRARILGVIILVLLVPAAHAAAQPAGTVAKGSRVRLESASVTPHAMTGVVVSFDETTLELRSDLGPLVVVPRGAISRLDVRVSRRSNWKAGALIGAAVGLFAGVSAESNCGGSLVCLEPHPAAVAGVGSVVFAGVGALVGSLWAKETWAPVVSGPKLSVAPTRKGGVVSLSFLF